jgi:hypothetical protein
MDTSNVIGSFNRILLQTKRTKILDHATTWTSFENMLRERSQPQKNIYYMKPLKKISKIGN